MCRKDSIIVFIIHSFIARNCAPTLPKTVFIPTTFRYAKVSDQNYQAKISGYLPNGARPSWILRAISVKLWTCLAGIDNILTNISIWVTREALHRLAPGKTSHVPRDFLRNRRWRIDPLQRCSAVDGDATVLCQHVYLWPWADDAGAAMVLGVTSAVFQLHVEG